jgi:folate-dependent phosphoribosylglycinamide formyltransferase PurN
MKTCRWAIFVSGQGSNLAALLDLRSNDIRLVISSRASAPALLKARRSGVPTLVLPKKIDWDEVLRELHERHITHIFLLGFMKVVPLSFLEKWQGPILNVHPSLLPSYPGLDSLARAHQDGAAIGATVHKVIAAVDAGDTIFQKQVYAPGAATAKKLAEVEFYMHLAEYELVKKSFQAASCWT